MPGHVKARSRHPQYPERFPVPDELVPWSAPAPDYFPVEFVHGAVVANQSDTKPGGWADPATPARAEIEVRGSHELRKTGQAWVYDPATQRPLNPRGRTGMTERGLLGKWGTNHAADPIVTRRNMRKPGRPLEMVAIRRKDTNDWAIPGGMVDPGETVSATMKREFTEEAGNVPESERKHFEAMRDELFDPSNAREVYRGYVDDPRNTDNAWMETVAMHFHCRDELGEMLKLCAGDDAAAVRWLEIGDHADDYQKLYASHKDMVDEIARAPPP